MDKKDRQDSRFLVNISALRSQVRSPLITTQSARTEVLQVLHHRRAFTTRSHITIRRSLLNLLRSEDHSSPEQFLSDQMKSPKAAISGPPDSWVNIAFENRRNKQAKKKKHTRCPISQS